MIALQAEASERETCFVPAGPGSWQYALLFDRPSPRMPARANRARDFSKVDTAANSSGTAARRRGSRDAPRQVGGVTSAPGRRFSGVVSPRHSCALGVEAPVLRDELRARPALPPERGIVENRQIRPHRMVRRFRRLPLATRHGPHPLE